MRVVALLKGVNVGGHKKVPMAELRAAMAASGFGETRTLLQSGNVVLEYPAWNLPALPARLAALLMESFGVDSKVVVRSSKGLAEAAAADPLLPWVTDASRHFVGFASDAPSSVRSGPLNAENFGENLLQVVGKHVYMWCPAGLSASPFFKMDLDRLLGVTVTSRNWRTVTALAELVSAPSPPATS